MRRDRGPGMGWSLLLPSLASSSLPPHTQSYAIFPGPLCPFAFTADSTSAFAFICRLPQQSAGALRLTLLDRCVSAR
ncbi:hypothetical protein F5884DRAFT_772896 [Xylogone sp. PMI_703]|nr:hypothetical protein F5884DRAFT_772896 [Xylogone sp. PMI_703]